VGHSHSEFLGDRRVVERAAKRAAGKLDGKIVHVLYLWAAQNSGRSFYKLYMQIKQKVSKVD
jgi:hypothetical protein